MKNREQGTAVEMKELRRLTKSRVDRTRQAKTDLLSYLCPHMSRC